MYCILNEVDQFFLPIVTLYNINYLPKAQKYWADVTDPMDSSLPGTSGHQQQFLRFLEDCELL